MLNLDQAVIFSFVVILGYATFVAPITSPIWYQSKEREEIFWRYRKYIWLIFALLFWETCFERVGPLFSLSLLFIAGTVALLQASLFWQRLSAILFAGSISTTLPWWRFSGGSMDLSYGELGLVLIIFAGTLYILEKKSDKDFSYDSMPTFSVWGQRVLYGIIFILSIFYVGYQGLILGDAKVTTWHHWGAYIGPARLTLSGAIPLFDFPVQYGIGPTLMSAAACRFVNCWDGFYFLASAFTLAFFFALALLAIKITQREGLVVRLLALSCVIVCSLLWTSFPAGLISPLSTPSTSGMRFFPAVAMGLYLVTISSSVSSGGLTRRQIIFGHAIWVFGLFWSPEAGIHTTIVWTPFLVWASVFKNGTGFSIRVFIWESCKVLGVFGVIMASLTLIYFLSFGVLPKPLLYASFLQNPPGVLSINSSGPIWLAMTCFGLWIVAINKPSSKPSSEFFTRDKFIGSWVLFLLSLVVFSYFLGRSHDNNILNLLVYFMLLLFSVRRIAGGSGVRVLANALISASLAWVPLFGWGGYVRAFQESRSFGVDLSQVMNYGEEHSVVAIASHNARISGLTLNDALLDQQKLREALDYIASNWDEPVEIIDLNMLIDARASHLPWSGVHPISTSSFMTDTQRKKMLERVAARIQESGWVLVHKDLARSSVIQNYDEVYRRNQTHKFGNYQAIRFILDFDHH